MDFSGERLKSAIRETFENRKSKLDVIVAFEPEFSDDSNKERQWTSFLRAKRVDISLGFNEVIAQVEMFLMPIVEGLGQENDFPMTWVCSLCMWKAM